MQRAYGACSPVTRRSSTWPHRNRLIRGPEIFYKSASNHSKKTSSADPAASDANARHSRRWPLLAGHGQPPTCDETSMSCKGPSGPCPPLLMRPINYGPLRYPPGRSDKKSACRDTAFSDFLRIVLSGDRQRPSALHRPASPSPRLSASTTFVAMASPILAKVSDVRNTHQTQCIVPPRRRLATDADTRTGPASGS
jgi:hypothetical protein